ncbi:Bacterial non-heme ferritin [Pontiella desulfatans]|uniref:Ferritin n=1 Tax=Pontiella desulfatans TaxID=2750659 RepID=A0A6C2U6W4_PONDE|nr:ferritin [Pontiella desulfatans]VGO15643.1 Bacterial non-heme ferritin [Pontiella desulfatans]
MISEKMQEELNEQVNKEFYSAYMYLAMSAYCNTIGLPGFEHWMRMQYEEEIMHVTKMYDYIMGQGRAVHLKAIEEPPKEYGTPLEIIQKTLEHEQFVTKMIHQLMDLAVQEKDYATQTFLQWYVTEQVEEEANVNDILAPLRMVGGDKSGLMMIDQKLAGRPAPVPLTAK